MDTDEHRNTRIFFGFYLRTKSAFICVLLVSAHRQTLEVRVVCLRVFRLVSAPACKQIQENLHGLIGKLPWINSTVRILIGPIG